MPDVLRRLLEPPELEACTSARDFWERTCRRTEGLHEIDQAITGGLLADRLGFAFAAGYQAALRSLVPSLPLHGLCSLCATEEGGVHPRAMATALRPDGDGRWRMSGHKQLITLAPEADWLLVVASTGLDESGRNRLRLVRLEAGAPGVTVKRMPDLPFVPEIPHGEVVLEEVAVTEADLLPGDGFTRYLRPFRTIEDLHVYGAALGYLLGVAGRSGWPRHVREHLLALLTSMRALALEDPGAPEVHVALAGAFTLGRKLIADTGPLWAVVDQEVRERWERDRGLLNVAEKARAQRIERAWAALAATTG